MDNAIRYPHLYKSAVLADFSGEQKAAFLNQCVARVYEARQQILTQGDRAPGMFILAHGLVEVTCDSGLAKPTVLVHVKPGEQLGEIEAMADAECIATCTARRRSVLLFCPTPLLNEYLRKPVFLRNIARVIRNRLDNSNLQKTVDLHLPVEQKLSSYLFLLSENGSDRVEAGQSYLAELTGCSRQTVNKLLGKLRNEGLIDIRKGEVRILDREALEKRCHPWPTTAPAPGTVPIED